jgi:hypothetical protein
MATTTKALATARELIDIWTKKVGSTLPVIVQTYDASGNPVITLSADVDPAFGEKVVVVKISPIAWTATDIVGHSVPNFTPHQIDLCTEMNYAATTDNVADILTPVELLPIIAEISKRNMIVNWFQTANGTVPSASAMVVGNLKKSDSDLYWSAQKAQ